MFRRSASKFTTVALLLATFFLFSGCPTPSKQEPRVTTLAPLPLNPPTIEQSPFEAVLVQTPGAPNTALRDLTDSVLPEEKLQLPHGKIPLSSWAPLCGFLDVRSVANSNPPMLDLISPGGTLTLYIGQRFAKWNGINVGLGFAPMPERGQIVVHSVDVLKNFYPLGLGSLSIPKSVRTLVLDPGHGGADPGSQGSIRKAVEKDLALDWALRVERLLANTSWRVVLTRRDDRDIPLLERVAIADANNGDLFISLHFNALESSGNGKADETGIETYCLTPVGAPSNIIRNFEDDLRRSYPNNEFDAQNLLLASRMQASLVSATGRKDRGVRRARFMTVVREQKRPAVLVEGGFLSNPAEASQILQPDFRERMARAVCNALPD